MATPNLDQPIVSALAQWIHTQCTHSNKCLYGNYECSLNVCECMNEKLKCIHTPPNAGQPWWTHSDNVLASCIIGETVQRGQVTKCTA